MSWSLSASGHTDDPETEKALAALIGAALKQAGDAVSTASFYGGSVSGDPREVTQ